MKWNRFAERFPMLVGEEWKTFKASIAATKGNIEPVVYRMVKGRREGIDGRNRFLACQDLKLKCKLRQIALRDDEVKAYIIVRNLTRRHLTPEFRQELVAELHADGKTLREIAAVLGISTGTVQRDLGAPNGARTAQNPGKTGSSKTYCPHCQTLLRKGLPPKKNCPMCREENTGPKKKKRKGAREVPVDAAGSEVPPRCRDAFCDPWVQSSIDFLGTTLASFWQERLADGMAKRKKHFPFFEVKDFTDGVGFAGNYLEQILEHLKANRPAFVCPLCAGRGCPTCRMSGLVPRDLFKKLEKAHAHT